MTNLPIDTIQHADALTFLRGLPDGCVQTIVTSPPYFGLRDYGVDGQIGLEQTPQEYVAALVAVFREARRVLRDDGTLWLNLGDSYAQDKKWGGSTGGKHVKSLHGDSGIGRNRHKTGLEGKNLIGIPWRTAFALQDAGWILRSEIIWSKPNAMPEPVTDRPTKAHEQIFLFAKSQHYYYDQEAIAEPSQSEGGGDFSQAYADAQPEHGGLSARKSYTTRNKRSVWTVSTKSFKGAHFATFPTELIEPCILAGSPQTACAVCGAPYVRITEREPMQIKKSGRADKMGKKGRTQASGTMVSPARSLTVGFASSCRCNSETTAGVVLDPFMGSGTTALVARYHGRHYLGCELNADYIDIANQRLRLPFEPRHTPANDDVSGLPLFAMSEANS